MASVFILVILAINLWNEAIAVPATKSLKSENLHSRRNLAANGLGATPPMGWDSWYHFYCQIDEQTIFAQADALVNTGLSALGYKYIIIDDCWGQPNRDAQGNVVANPTTFPDGILRQAEYAHAKGLKLGLYAEAGTISCTNTTAGSLGHEHQDAQTFASWGVDYLKYDNCNGNSSTVQSRFSAMAEALSETGNQIFFAVSDWGVHDPALWAPQIANSWRTTSNIYNDWEIINQIASLNDQWAAYAGPGGWNDPDVLQIGNGNLTIEEYRSQFSLWALMKAPLMIAADLRTLTEPTLQILRNKEVIAVNQDPLGVQGKKVNTNADFQVWAGPLSDGQTVVLLLNRSNVTASITTTWEEIGLANNTVVRARDIWQHKDMQSLLEGKITYHGLEPHACKMYVLETVDQPLLP